MSRKLVGKTSSRTAPKTREAYERIVLMALYLNEATKGLSGRSYDKALTEIVNNELAGVGWGRPGTIGKLLKGSRAKDTSWQSITGQIGEALALAFLFRAGFVNARKVRKAGGDLTAEAARRTALLLEVKMRATRNKPYAFAATFQPNQVALVRDGGANRFLFFQMVRDQNGDVTDIRTVLVTSRAMHNYARKTGSKLTGISFTWDSPESMARLGIDHEDFTPSRVLHELRMFGA